MVSCPRILYQWLAKRSSTGFDIHLENILYIRSRGDVHKQDNPNSQTRHHDKVKKETNIEVWNFARSTRAEWCELRIAIAYFSEAG